LTGINLAQHAAMSVQAHAPLLITSSIPQKLSSTPDDLFEARIGKRAARPQGRMERKDAANEVEKKGEAFEKVDA